MEEEEKTGAERSDIFEDKYLEKNNATQGKTTEQEETKKTKRSEE